MRLTSEEYALVMSALQSIGFRYIPDALVGLAKLALSRQTELAQVASNRAESCGE